jgi:penicillin-binding protein 1A
MERTYNRKVARSYEVPPGVVRMNICEASGKRPSSRCSDTIEEYFIAGTEPAEICDIHSGSSPSERPDRRERPSEPSIDDTGF